MTLSISPTQDDAQIAVGAFLAAVLPSGVDWYAGIVNRVPEPPAKRYVTLILLRVERLRTNVDSAEDTRFTGTIAGTTLTAAFGADDFGAIRVGATIFGTGVESGTTVVRQITGSAGEDGTYEVSKSQTIGPVLMSAGQKTIEQGAKLTFQIDVHTENNTASDIASTISTTLRDPYGVSLFEGTGVSPLYADDPRYMPFVNENQQSEWRWVVEACFQANLAVAVPAQYADSVNVSTIDANA